jgi:hypothetical protein
MTQTGTRMTAEELLRLPDRGVRYELIAGELHEMPPAGGEHGFVDDAARLLHADDTLTGEPVLPGFACRVGELFG